MEIDFRTAREALIYEIGIKTGLLQREKELQTRVKDNTIQNFTLQRIQQDIDFTINIIKGL